MVTVGYNPSTGKALWGTGGLLCIGCCGGYPYSDYDCTYCTAGETPEYVEVVISGATGCAGCVNRGFFDSSEYEYDSIDGTYILHQNYASSYCQWIGEITATGRCRFWSGLNCSGSPGAWVYPPAYPTGHKIILTKTSSSNLILNFALHASADTFYGSAAVSDGCVGSTGTPTVITNERTICGTNVGNCAAYLGQSGSASIRDLIP